ncbi:Peptidyl-prolyl isomerase cwc27 [Coemansia sp. RSA 2322]|nr:Peptidyl-prolyl isomerase cwc27 [Coemansia sp. RSA 2322]
MSNIYVSEPPTCGKVVLDTTAGEIDIELWSKQAPKACRNFIQLCLEGLYDNTIFHRVVPGWIVQGGDPTGTGEGKSVVGDSLFNALKLAEGDVDKDSERPVYPKSITKTRVLDNPFTDIAPRTAASREDTTQLQLEPGRQKKPKAVKDRKLLSFGEDDDEDDVIGLQGGATAKSSHDLLTQDPALSNEPAVLVSTNDGATPPKPDLAVQLSESADSFQPELRPQIPNHTGSNESKELAVGRSSHSASRASNAMGKQESLKSDVHELEDGGSRSGAKSKASTGALSEMLVQYKSSLTNRSQKPLKRSAREDDLLARLGSFQSKIRKAKLQPPSSVPEASQALDEALCKIHSLAACKSCQRSGCSSHGAGGLARSSDAAESGGWLNHTLHFNQSRVRPAVEYAPKFDDYVTIDPRDQSDAPQKRS